MKTTTLLTITALAMTTLAGTALAAGKSGEAVFKEKCAACHPDGGNIINPKATLRSARNAKVIVDKIRKGGNGMTAFDQKAISDAEAKAVAAYIVKNFKK
jgi:cytochrome c6